MLYTATVKSELLKLLKNVMDDDAFTDFKLVGGTALALQIGHRISIDLDFFNPLPFDENMLLDYLEDNYNFKSNYQSKNTLKGEIEGIKVDFISHQFRYVNEGTTIDGIRLASLADIAAMKVNAIVRSGERVKDFIDLAFLSTYFSFIEIQEFYVKKYPNVNAVMMIKALTFFEDINFNEPINVINKNYNWKTVQERLENMITEPNRIFSPLSF